MARTTSSLADETPTDPTATDAIESAKQDHDTPGDDTEKLPDWYCPGCGLRYTYQQKCTGKPESPHQPIEVVSTAELSGDAANQTPAPSTENLG